CGKGCGSQHIVTAAVSRSTVNHCLFLCSAGFLVQTGQSVKLAENSNYWFPRTIRSLKRRFNIRKILFYRKPFFFQKVAEYLNRIVLLERRFRAAPDLVAGIQNFFCLFVDLIPCYLLSHFTSPFL